MLPVRTSPNLCEWPHFRSVWSIVLAGQTRETTITHTAAVGGSALCGAIFVNYFLLSAVAKVHQLAHFWCVKVSQDDLIPSRFFQEGQDEGAEARSDHTVATQNTPITCHEGEIRQISLQILVNSPISECWIITDLLTLIRPGSRY